MDSANSKEWLWSFLSNFRYTYLIRKCLFHICFCISLLLSVWQKSSKMLASSEQNHLSYTVYQEILKKVSKFNTSLNTYNWPEGRFKRKWCIFFNSTKRIEVNEGSIGQTVLSFSESRLDLQKIICVSTCTGQITRGFMLAHNDCH